MAFWLQAACTIRSRSRSIQSGSRRSKAEATPSDFGFRERHGFGNPGGSSEATRRSFNKDFLLALAADFKRGPEAIAKVRRQQPAAYMKICALLVPREMKVE